MDNVFLNLIDSVLTERESFNRIWFAGGKTQPPQFSYQVNFPRLELVLKGEYINQLDDGDNGICQISLMGGDAIYIPPNSWNKPSWNTECSVLSLLFGKRQLGFSLVSKTKDSPKFYDVQKYSIQAWTGHAIDPILTALNMLATEPQQQPMDEHLLQALLSYTRNMLQIPLHQSKNRTEDLYQGICIYIQENFHRAISRDTIANRFNITPNHLSRLFRQQGHMRLADYICWVRIERAKFMLRQYPFRLTEVASRCGFVDVNYFCRVFKNKTGRTPSEYRTVT